MPTLTPASPTPPTLPTAEPVPELQSTLDGTVASLWRWRAQATLDAMDRTFAVSGSSLYRERYGIDAMFDVAFLWPMTQVVACHIDMAQVRGTLVTAGDVRRISKATEAYYDDTREPPAFSSYLAPPVGWLSDRYYDDNVWLGIELMRTWQLTGDPLALARANEIFDFLITGWDTEGPAPGGIFWVEGNSNSDRGTTTTGTGALLGLMLYQALPPGPRATYVLDWATKMYAWVYETLETSDGLFRDHVRPDGTIDYAPYSYNQGAMIGANLELYRLTGDALFLDRAERTAHATLELTKDHEISAQEISFNGIFFWFLLQLDDVRPAPEYRDRLLTYAEQLWEDQRNPDTGLATTSAPLTLLDQAAMVRVFALAAVAAGR